MYRQAPSKNQKSKGIKVKYVLQICLLLAVCFWLIYQVKHSHDKKKEFEENDTKGTLQRTSSEELIKLGRKDVHPRVEGTISKNEKNDAMAEEEEISGEDIEDNKSEEDELEDKKVQRKEDEAMGGGDYETNKHEQEKSDADVDREEDFVDDEEEKGDGVENETQETDSEHSHGETDKKISADTDHGEDVLSINEAREENYKADDASSAVTHNTQISATKNENENVENSNDKPKSILEDENKESNSGNINEGESRKDLEVEGGQMAKDNHLSNVTTIETKVDMLENSEIISSPKNLVTEGLDDHLPSNSSSEVTTENHDLPSQNATEGEPELDHGQGILTEGTYAERSDLQTFALEWDDDTIINGDGSHLDSNSTGSTESKDATFHSEELSDSSNNNTESSASEKIIRLDASLELGNNTESASEKNDGSMAGKSDTSNDANERLDSTITENPEGVQHDTIDISDTSSSLEEKDVRMDLDTLPAMQTEGTNNEDAAAE